MLLITFLNNITKNGIHRDMIRCANDSKQTIKNFLFHKTIQYHELTSNKLFIAHFKER